MSAGLIRLVLDQRLYLLLALGAVPGASGWGFERRVEAVGVEDARAVVAGLQLSILLTDGTVVIMLQVLLFQQEEYFLHAFTLNV